MTDIIIIVVLCIIIGLGIMNTIKHLKNKSGCCSGPTYKPKEKKLNKVLYKKTFMIEGMTCENCVNRVQERLNRIEGISSKVNLRRREAVISYEKDVEDEIIISIIEKAGYRVN